MTSSAAEPAGLPAARRRTFLALFTALAIVVHTFETLLPTPLPWLRLGLANALALVVLFLYGPGAAWSLTLSRIVLGALLLGRLFTPGFWLALAGGCLATLVMTGLHRFGRGRFGPVGISVAGAVSHACGQTLAAWALLVRHDALWRVLPLFLLFAIATGLLTGWVAALLLERLKRHPALADT
ncbi:MAG: Gx transporter family protein [Desulfuromonadales bacterium]|nr:Gx transporter family protein [Desulfuromonadales bacterium]